MFFVLFITGNIYSYLLHGPYRQQDSTSKGKRDGRPINSHEKCKRRYFPSEGQACPELP